MVSSSFRRRQCRQRSRGGKAFPHADFTGELPKWLPGLKSDTLHSFLERNASPSILDPQVIQRLGVASITRAEIEQIGSGGTFWVEFYKRHPSATGYVEFSNLGLASDEREALAYCGRASDTLLGRGFLVLLRYNGERWSAVGWRHVWQS